MSEPEAIPPKQCFVACPPDAPRCECRERQESNQTTADAAILAVLTSRYGAAEAQRIHRLATTTHKGRVDSTAYSRWVDAAREARG